MAKPCRECVLAGEIRVASPGPPRLTELLGPEISSRVNVLCAKLQNHEKAIPPEVSWAALELMAALNEWALSRRSMRAVPVKPAQIMTPPVTDLAELSRVVHDGGTAEVAAFEFPRERV